MRWAVLATGLLACLALSVTPRPLLLLNTTASVPVGLYRVVPIRTPQVGDLVVVTPEPGLADFLDEGGWLPRGVPLIKPVAAVAGQTVCRRNQDLAIDGRTVARALLRDGRGGRLPFWSGCRILGTGEVFLLAPAPASLDGRYFGITDGAQVQAKAHPLLVSGGKGTP
ncbi:S26 family signal peptidase [Caulobacter segnis]|uniref:S26 family signal peptidase n=1 Tax=Caulobacter segnis TaxID=88688 RepID=UPI00285501F9|nr:S26 family signal peptidase [Caulobacter segnis]MDR6624489.1 type IV secretory pathway protease TraF [Caulobacter segnis]